MPQINTALVTLRWPETVLAKLRDALAPADMICCSPRNASAIQRALGHADVALINGDLDKRYLQAPALRWVHCGHAGVERSASPELFRRGLLLTCSAGRSAPALAEHAMLFLLALSHRFDRFVDAQRRHRWGISGQGELRALQGRTLGIAGLGHTGRELAVRARAFGMHVIGYRRSTGLPPGVDRVYREDELFAFLAQCDCVVLTLPLSDRTHHLLDGRAIAAMRPGACLVNIGRGGVVDETALIDALRSGHLAGAAIDVAQEEPLPVKSPLWNAPNLLITPHVTPQLADRNERALDILLENIRRYRADEPLLNQLTEADVYTPRPGTDPEGGLVAPTARLLRRLRHRWRTR